MHWELKSWFGNPNWEKKHQIIVIFNKTSYLFPFINNVVIIK